MTIETALVAGVSSDIGIDIARRLLVDGARVCGTFRSRNQSLDGLAEEFDASLELIECDVRDDSIDDMVVSAIDSLGEIDAFINCIGHPVFRASFLEVPDSVWLESIELNLLSAVRLTRSVLHHAMIPAGAGSIVHVSSVSARTGSPGLGIHYATCKSALNTFVLGLSREIAQHGVRVNSVAPGTIETRLHESSPAGHLDRMASRIPLGRVGRVDDVTEAVVFLASDSSSFITGETLWVTGGL